MECNNSWCCQSPVSVHRKQQIAAGTVGEKLFSKIQRFGRVGDVTHSVPPVSVGQAKAEVRGVAGKGIWLACLKPRAQSPALHKPGRVVVLVTSLLMVKHRDHGNLDRVYGFRRIRVHPILGRNLDSKRHTGIAAEAEVGRAHWK